MPGSYLNKIFITAAFLVAVFLMPGLVFSSSVSPDAIATRVIPNPEHLGPLRWYQANIKNQGSPQSMYVDGYEAVRDGRTVYVNVANIDSSNNKFYTNIYLISFSQDVEQATQDIFGQMLIHWKFNVNLGDEQKQGVRNDTKRLADLAEIKQGLENYKITHNGVYPPLSAGSYVSGKSISVWPSWQGTLAKELGVSLPVDPVNKLGACPEGYDRVTCWNEKDKKFFGLPANSQVYVYTHNSDSSYDVCALMESGFITDLSQGACNGSKVGYNAPARFLPPVINCGNMEGKSGKPFAGQLSLSGPDASRFKFWSIQPVQPGSWNDWRTGDKWRWKSGSDGLVFSTIGVLPKIMAEKAGKHGSYAVAVMVANNTPDKETASSIKQCSINIKTDSYCGDGRVQNPNAEEAGGPADDGREECDDGNNNNGDGCGANCAIEENWDCVDPGNGPSVCSGKTKLVDCAPNPNNSVWNGSSQINQTWSGSSWQPLNTSAYSTDAGACKFKCQTNYTWNGSACDFSTRTVNCSDKPANTGWNISSTVLQTWNGSSWQPSNISAYGASEGACKFICSENYTWDGANCVADTRAVNCAAKPANTDWNTNSALLQTWDGSAWQPSNASAYDNTPGICRFKCRPNYTWNGAICRADSRVVSCTALPANAGWNGNTSVTQVWDGSAWQPSNASAYSTDAGACKFVCSTNYTWDGSACASGTRTISCSAKPDNADWNTDSSVSQTWDGSAWQPSNTSAYSTAPGVCKFKCQPDSYWNNGACDYYASCLDLKNHGITNSGVHKIDPDGNGGAGPFNAYCDMSTEGGGWTLIMRSVNDKFGYDDSYWTSVNTLNDDNFDFNSAGKSKYQSFNTVPFSEIRTSATNDFSSYYKYSSGATYGNALQLFSGPSIVISSGVLNGYFNGLAPAYNQHWPVCGGYEAEVLTLGINISKNWGPHSPVYSICDWGGGARFGQIVNGYHGGTGDIQGQGWGARNMNNSDSWNFPISQLLWVR